MLQVWLLPLVCPVTRRPLRFRASPEIIWPNPGWSGAIQVSGKVGLSRSAFRPAEMAEDDEHTRIGEQGRSEYATQPLSILSF